MTMLIVPDCVHAAINQALDAALAEVPEAAKDRESLYRELLAYFHHFGRIPEFSLAKNSCDAEGDVA